MCVAVIDRCSNLSVVLHLMLTDTAGLESLLQKDPVLDSVSAREKKKTCWKMSVVNLLPFGLNGIEIIGEIIRLFWVIFLSIVLSQQL